MEIVILLVVLAAVLVGSTAALVASRRGRDRGDLLEPPPEPPVVIPPERAGPTQAPDGATDVPDSSSGVGTLPPPGEAPDVEGDPDVLVPEPDEATVAEIEEALAEAEASIVEEAVKPRIRDRLTKTRSLFAGYFGSILARSAIDAETWDDLEEALLRADVGIGLTTSVLDDLRAEVKDKGITEPDALLEQLKGDLKVRLQVSDRGLNLKAGATNVWLFVGVNGVGKTTTIGKLAKAQSTEGRQVVMAAGDTFRAAAAEQLGMWAERTGADLVRGAEGGDPSSVIFDAVQRASSRGSDLVLADTAGRLHTKTNLMDELRKVRRVAEKPPGEVTEVLLVIDATTGQNSLTQAQQFLKAVEVTGVVLTKLDGSAKGGIVLAIQSELGLPVKLVGLGETVDDLVPFDPDEFVEALFA
ncbi:MAG: signal recognition particle-docking protein FtsY [Acidimicrobiales bacterium]